MDLCREFDCEDCGVHVYSYGWPSDETPETHCLGCSIVRSMERLTPQQEAELRKLFHCELPERMERWNEH